MEVLKKLEGRDRRSTGSAAMKSRGRKLLKQLKR